MARPSLGPSRSTINPLTTTHESRYTSLGASRPQSKPTSASQESLRHGPRLAPGHPKKQSHESMVPLENGDSIEASPILGITEQQKGYPDRKRLRIATCGLITTLLLLLAASHSAIIPRPFHSPTTQTPEVPSIGTGTSVSRELPGKRALPTLHCNIIYPAYFGPEKTADWKRLYSQILKYNKILQFTIVVNPSNGPGGRSEIARYTSTLRTLRSFSNVNVLGYIHQSWGKRSITNDVNIWLNHFPNQLDGFFLDEMPSVNSVANRDTVSDNNGYVYSRPARNFRRGTRPIVVQNPGTEIDASFYRVSNPADVTIVLENTANHLQRWTSLHNRLSAKIKPTTLGIILHTVGDQSLAATVKTMLKYADNIFATNVNADDAYLGVSNNWAQFLSYAAKYGGAITKKAPKTKLAARVTWSARTAAVATRMPV
ncbi:hypothetical protein DRE_02895 [Drechslerella stenobrocha 248]|uniref:Spherulin-4 n=1 Tax=Drechslerella stenobrocha 248 TaxID=1043628 RepID=W7IF48_9PEZI|nr:hypothetical protein DRE_02895 [Drechslerella stenobrocha 248]